MKSTNMIPDNTFIFKQYGVPRNFDDHAVRLRQLLQQDAMPMLESSGHLLAVCPVCKHPWYKAGSQEYPRLTSQQLALLGATLHIDIHLLHLLPRSLCSICSAVYLGGMFSVEGISNSYVIPCMSSNVFRISFLSFVTFGNTRYLCSLVLDSP